MSQASTLDSPNIWERFQNWVEKARLEVLRMTKLFRLKWDKSLLQHERKRIFQQLGEQSYSMHKSGRFDLAQVNELISSIDAINERIQGHDAEIREASRRTLTQNSNPDTDPRP